MRNACGAFYEIPNGNRFLTQCLQCNRHGRKAVIWTPVSRKRRQSAPCLPTATAWAGATGLRGGGPTTGTVSSAGRSMVLNAAKG